MGPITFRTWDFSGQVFLSRSNSISLILSFQLESQSIYQYFFTRRTLYLICWKMNDYDVNEEIFDHIHNLLINIQVGEGRCLGHESIDSNQTFQSVCFQLNREKIVGLSIPQATVHHEECLLIRVIFAIGHHLNNHFVILFDMSSDE